MSESPTIRQALAHLISVGIKTGADYELLMKATQDHNDAIEANRKRGKRGKGGVDQREQDIINSKSMKEFK